MLLCRPLVVLLVVLAALPPGDAQGATPPVPAGFVGIVADGPVFDAEALKRARSSVDRELDLMVGAGVESVRLSFYWAAMQPDRAAPIDFRATDRIVAAAARRRLELLPVVLWPPDWAARHPGEFASPPADADQYATFVAALAARYGTRGTLWAERPSLPKVALDEWQLWNEPALKNFWLDQPFARDYVALLRASHARLRRADPRARIVLAGLVHESWEALARIYRAGGRRWFDSVALHPFTREPDGVLRIIERNRTVMARNDDGRKPVYVTETSWPSSLGKVPSRYGYETDERGQAQLLTRGMRTLAAHRRRLRIDRVYWYTWMTLETDPTYPFDYAGLRRLERRRVVAKPALGAYRSVALRLEGCRAKRGTAAGCR
jgi:hypothetical protein